MGEQKSITQEMTQDWCRTLSPALGEGWSNICHPALKEIYLEAMTSVQLIRQCGRQVRGVAPRVPWP
jgi:hypothetical protein